jgi:altronate dehydratase
VKAVLVISARDNVATALEPLDAGQRLMVNERELLVRDAVPAGHKIALEAIRAGSPVMKYGSEIGIATCEIPAGAHVHVHNVASTRGRGDLAGSPSTAAAGRLAEPS